MKFIKMYDKYGSLYLLNLDKINDIQSNSNGLTINLTDGQCFESRKIPIEEIEKCIVDKNNNCLYDLTHLDEKKKIK